MKSLKKVENELKKGWKRLKKSSSTSFRVHAAPESWSKYTTTQKHFSLRLALTILDKTFRTRMDLSWKKLKMKMKTRMKVNQTKNGQKLTFNILATLLSPKIRKFEFWQHRYHPKSDIWYFGNVVICQKQTIDKLSSFISQKHVFLILVT